MNTKIASSPLVALLFALFSLCAIAPLHSQDAPLRNGDSIELRIGGVPGDQSGAIAGNYVVDNEGKINLSYINKISIAGKTSAEAADAIEATYKAAEIFTNPTVTISTQGSARFVNVGGEVRSPNRIAFTPDLTVNTAINAAGGFTEFANRKKVRLLRGKEVMVIDATKILRDPSLDIPVKPGDQIFVEQSFL